MTEINEFDARASTWDEDQMKVDRAKRISELITQNIEITQEMKGFEYGCGTGLVSFNLNKLLKSITLADNSDGMISVLKDKIETQDIDNMFPVKLDLLKDSYIGGKFDLIYTSMTLHHIVEIDEILEKLCEITSPNGYLCIADLDEEDGTFHQEGFIGHNGFKREKLEKKLEHLGLKTLHYELFFEMKRKHTGDKVYNVFMLIAKKEGN